MTITRRGFLHAAAGGAAMAWQSNARVEAYDAAGQASANPASPSSSAHSSFDPWIEVRADNMRSNVREISRRAGGRPILAVIKNNGYGAGVVETARIVSSMKEVAGVAVVKLHEANTLRDAGIGAPILLLGPFDEKNLTDLVARDITPMVYTAVGDVFDKIASARQKPARIHICVDTGIGRVGVPFREAAALIRDLAARRSIAIDGVMMTFTEDPAFDPEQLSRFTTLCSSLEKEGVRLGRRHAASSFALFQRPDGFLDMVRPGMALFGVYSEQPFRTMNVMTLQPAVSLKARVAYVKRLQAGDSAGYERAYVARRDVWLATLPVGHADGWPRAAAKGGRVRINGALYPIVASISASHSIVELGDEARAKIGDVAVMFDGENGSRPEDVANACGASVYDLMMHLNPLLPRLVV